MSNQDQLSSPWSLPEMLENYYFDVSGQVARVSDFTSIGDGWETEVYSFTLTQQERVEHLVLRMYPGENAAQKSEREYDGMTLLRKNSYPVPQVFELETDRDSLGKPFIVMQKIDGSPLGVVMRENPARQAELLTKFCGLLVDLHRLDYHVLQEYINSLELEIDPTFVPPPDPDPAELLRQKFSQSSRLLIDQFGQKWAIPVFGWLEAYMMDIPTPQLSVLHGDFNWSNVLLTQDNTAYVIDWSGIEVGDYRYDLAWTMLLTQPPEARGFTLREYERLSGHPVDHLEYFEVIACLRRLFDFAVSLSSGAESLGMRPETVAIMRQQRNHYQQVYDLLQARTGLRLPEIETLLVSLNQ